MFADALKRDHNNFNVVRLAAAIAVAVSRSFALLIGSQDEPLSTSTPHTLGQHAVKAFFVLSDVMLSRSWVLSPNLLRFVCDRILGACGLVVAFVIAPFAAQIEWIRFFSDRVTVHLIRVQFQFDHTA